VSAIGLEREPIPEVRLALEAMATRFELILPGAETARLRAAGEEALAEIARLDRQLSCYSSASDVTWINTHAAREPVRVEPVLFNLLRRCQELAAATEGTFDITVGPLMHAWRLAEGSGVGPDDATVMRARRVIGFTNLILDEEASTVSFARPGVRLDLGAAGKGFAIDRAIDILRAHGVESALLHGGTSSVHALGSPTPGAQAGWRVAWHQSPGPDGTFTLRDGALSVSAVHGRQFIANGRRYGHVMDPRTGMPTRAASSAIVTGPGSLECDALSTALLVLGGRGTAVLRLRFPGYDGAVGNVHAADTHEN
jgi:thiamine biosynthesis lipoprotein